MMKYKIYLNELEEQTNKLVTFSKNDINTKISELKTIFDDVNWQGKGHNTFINGYNNKINYLEKMGNNILLLTEYLTNCHNDYSETNDKLIKSWDKFMDEIKGGNDEL